MDVKTVFILIALINTLIFVFLLMFIRFSEIKSKVLNIYLLSKFLHIIAWILLINRGLIYDFWSIGVANIFVVFAFGIEILAVTSSDGTNLNKRIKTFSLVALVLSVGSFSMMYYAENIRIIYASVILFIWHSIGGQQFLLKKNRNTLKLTAGVVYLTFSFIAIVRILSAAFDGNQTMLNGGIIEAITSSAIFLSNFIGIVILMLLLKEEDEKKIRVNEQKFKNFTEFLPQIVFEIDIKGVITYVNKKGFDVTGYSQQDLMNGIRLLDIIAEEDKERILNRFSILMAGETETGEEYAIKTKNGDTIPVLIYSSLLVEGNKAIGLRGIIVDISARKKDEEKIRQLSTAVNQSSNTIVITDVDGNIEYVNSKFEDLTGYSPKEAMGLNPRVLNARTQPKGYYSKMWKTISKGETWKGEFHNKKKSGELFWESVTITPIKNSVGDVVNYMAIKEDITDKRRVLQEIKANQYLLKEAQRLAHVGHWELNLKEDKLSWSDEIYRIFDTNPQAFKPTFDEFIDKIHPDDREMVSEAYSNSLKNKLPYEIEHRLLLGNDKIKYVIEKCSTEYDKDGLPLLSIGTVQDITSSKKTEREMVNQTKQLKTLVATKDKFFSIIAHDLRSPVGSMVGLVQLLIENYDAYDDDDKKEYLNVLYGSVDKAYNLLENLLLWSRAEQGTMKFSPENQNISLMVAESVELLRPSAENKKIVLQNKIQQELYVLVDRDMVLTIIRNLISNAIKFTPKGGNIIITSRTVEDDNKNSYAEISVEDNGVGIPYEIQFELFNVSNTITTSGTDNEKGTGLGLVLCKEFVVKHKGRIWVESDIEKGSKFSFTLPLQV